MDIVLLIHMALTNLTTVMCNIHDNQNRTNINDNTDANAQKQVKIIIHIIQSNCDSNGNNPVVTTTPVVDGSRHSMFRAISDPSLRGGIAQVGRPHNCRCWLRQRLEISQWPT